MAAHLGDGLLAFIRELSHPAAKYEDGQDCDGHGDKNDQAQFKVGENHQRQRPGQGQGIAHC